MFETTVSGIKFNCEYKGASYNWGDPYPAGYHCTFKDEKTGIETIFVSHNEVEKEGDLEKRIAYKLENHMY